MTKAAVPLQSGYTYSCQLCISFATAGFVEEVWDEEIVCVLCMFMPDMMCARRVQIEEDSESEEVQQKKHDTCRSRISN